MTVGELRRILEGISADLSVCFPGYRDSYWYEVESVEMEHIKPDHEMVGPGDKTKLIVVLSTG